MVVNEASVKPQSRSPWASPGLTENAALWRFPGARPLREPQRVGSSPSAPANKGTSFVYQGKRGYLQHFGQKNDRL